MTPPTPKTPPHPGFGGVDGANTGLPRIAFAPANYTQSPNALVDQFMARLSGAEYKVLSYIVRRTFGFHRESARVSAAQLCGGLVGRDGRRLDWGTGLSRTQVFAAVKSLEEKGLVAVRRTGNVGGRATESNTYTLWVQGADNEAVMGDEWQGQGEGQTQTTPPSAEIVPPSAETVRGVRFNNRTGPSTETGRAYKEKKQSGKDSPLVPHGRTQGRTQNQNQTQQPRQPCTACNGFGVLNAEGTMVGVHGGTLAEVRAIVGVEAWGYKFCECVMGQGWAALLEDEKKGVGLPKGKVKGK